MLDGSSYRQPGKDLNSTTELTFNGKLLDSLLLFILNIFGAIFVILES